MSTQHNGEDELNVANPQPLDELRAAIKRSINKYYGDSSYTALADEIMQLIEEDNLRQEQRQTLQTFQAIRQERLGTKEEEFKG